LSIPTKTSYILYKRISLNIKAPNKLIYKENQLLPKLAIISALLVVACSQNVPKVVSIETKGHNIRTSGIRLSEPEAKKIGAKIWKNECGGTLEGLTSWNKGEYFASLGIGHFIWYSQVKEGPFEESFPKLIQFIASRGIRVPKIARTADCPWNSRAEFIQSKDSPQMNELRQFLHRTISLQTSFILTRLEQALPKMLIQVPVNDQKKIKRNFYKLLQSPQGKYALMDYVNFKGEGTNKKERYKGKGWGMLQVLEEMRLNIPSSQATLEFARSADHVLTRRVQNAPNDETKWLMGWRNRLKTYY